MSQTPQRRWDDGLEEEREYVHHLYERLDELRAQKQQQLSKVRSTGAIGSRQNQSERDSFATLYEDRLGQLDGVEQRLAFGRLDLSDPELEPRYIGRIGLTEPDQSRLLIDWRAPEASSFYQATAFDRHGVDRRRHLSLKGRDVVSIEDDVLDPEKATEPGSAQGDGALIAALNSRRTGRMGDIVATIQAEQDTVIRSPLAGVQVVQGGPGTGKTAVALHRAAYLLYAQRERLGRAGVLVVGPTDVFLRYIERVLPSLGETGVVLSSLSRLYPGLDAIPETNRETARVKGSLDMLEVIKRAVAQRQRLPAATRTLRVGSMRIKLKRGQVRRARDRARASHKPYNEAREVFVKTLLNELLEKYTEVVRKNGIQGSEQEPAELMEDLRTSRDVRVAINLCWMPMTPQGLLEGVFGKEDILQAVTPGWSPERRAALRREPGSPWTEADVPLLDEAAELLGPFDPAAAAASSTREAQRARDLENAEKALANVDAGLREEGIDGLVSAEALAGLNEAVVDHLDTAERAAADRTWTYGHVVVDEAQELSPMQWHLLFRRDPMKSMTVVGDMAQADAPAASPTWAAALEPFTGDRFRVAELTINYRTPRQVVELAERVATEAGLPFSAATAVRDAEVEPVLEQIESASALPDAALDALDAALAQVPGGLAAVITGTERVSELRTAAATRFGDRLGTGAGDAASGQDVLVLSAGEAKGLEFDVVVVADPGAIVRDSEGSVGNLYVALTRTTQALSVVTVGEDAPAALIP